MIQRTLFTPRGVLLLSLAVIGCLAEEAPARAGAHPAAGAPSPAAADSTKAAPQPRPHGARVSVAPDRVRVDDGDTVSIRWSAERL